MNYGQVILIRSIFSTENPVQDSTWHSVALDFYNHTAGESNFAQELPAMDFATDAWFLAADQKSVELMSGHVRNVYNYLFSQVTTNNCVFM